MTSAGEPGTGVEAAAAAYAGWYGALADPTRVLLLYAVAAAPGGQLGLDDLGAALGTDPQACADHAHLLAGAGFVRVAGDGSAAVVSIDPAACIGVPHVADVVLGTLATPPLRPDRLPPDVTTRAMTGDDLEAVREIYAEGIATRNATFETEVPAAVDLAAKWLPGHRWVAEADLDGTTRVVGWTAVSPVSARACYAGVGETSVYVTASARGRGVGRALVWRQVTEADAGGLWTLQTAIFPENRASIALHRAAGYRTLAVRPRIAQLDGVWRDTVLMERRRADD